MWLDNNIKLIKDYRNDSHIFKQTIYDVIHHDWAGQNLVRSYPLKDSTVIFYDHFGKDNNMFKQLYADGPKGVGYSFADKFLRYKTLPILDLILEQYPNHRYIKGEISCCPPGNNQSFHVDPRVFHRFSRRVHLPLITNPECTLDIDVDSHHLEPLCLYEFNNIVLHRSVNNGTTNRVHLILDLIQNDWFDHLTSLRPEVELYAGIHDDASYKDSKELLDKLTSTDELNIQIERICGTTSERLVSTY